MEMGIYMNKKNSKFSRTKFLKALDSGEAVFIENFRKPEKVKEWVDYPYSVQEVKLRKDGIVERKGFIFQRKLKK